jgi:tRNA pseudouridine13 synthase
MIAGHDPMKLKSRPDDFEVEELAEFPLGDGAFAVYLLTKESLGTPEAVTAIQQRWKLERRQIGYGGLKDKHAITRQWITIQRGPRRNMEQTHFSLVYQGQSPRAFTPHDILGNRFSIRLRGLSGGDAQRIVAAVPDLQRDGVPNYFDDQRFGSLGEAGEFIARPWCLGDYERTLWLALADPNPHDRPDAREEKRLLRENWGQWQACKQALPKSSRRSIITFLCDHPTDFRRAVALLRQDLRSLYLAAYQSHLWNQILTEIIRQKIPSAQRFDVRLETAAAPFFRTLTDEQRAVLHGCELPLPSARLHFDEGDPLRMLYGQVLEREGLELRELRVKYPRDSFFSKGQRAGVIVPEKFTAKIAADDLHRGQSAVRLQYTLPRGSYATIVVKRLTK